MGRPVALFVYDVANAFPHWSLPSCVASAFGRQDLASGENQLRRNMDFGASAAPSVCQELADAVCDVMRERHSIEVVGFLDDFGGCACEQEMGITCEQFEQVMGEMGIRLNKKKVQKGSKVVYLGIEVDSVAEGRLRLPKDKVEKYSSCIVSLLQAPTDAVTMKQLASMVGKLSWASTLVPSSSSRLVVLQKQLWGDFRTEKPRSGVWSKVTFAQLPAPFQKSLRGTTSRLWFQQVPVFVADRILRLTDDSRVALRWWLQALQRNSGVPLFLGQPHPGRWRRRQALGDCALLRSTGMTDGGVPIISSDACKEEHMVAGGFCFGAGNWSVNFRDQPDSQESSINVRELETMCMAVATIGPALRQQGHTRLLVVGDNKAAVGVFNRGCSASLRMNSTIEWLLDRTAKWGIEVFAKWVASADNERADMVSRQSSVASVQCFTLTESATREVESLLGTMVGKVWPGRSGDGVAAALGNTLLRLQRRWEEVLPTKEQDWLLVVPPACELERVVNWLETAKNGRVVVICPATEGIQTSRWWNQGTRVARRLLGWSPGVEGVMLTVRSRFDSGRWKRDCHRWFPHKPAWAMEAWMWDRGTEQRKE